jgi:hypothetical protein
LFAAPIFFGVQSTTTSTRPRSSSSVPGDGKPGILHRLAAVSEGRMDREAAFRSDPQAIVARDVGDADELHIILRSYCICDALADHAVFHSRPRGPCSMSSRKAPDRVLNHRDAR